MTQVSSRVGTWASFVKFEHTLFSLPLLYAGAVVAIGTMPDVRTSLLILGAGTGARAAALGLNRIIDRHIDARNPRTAVRELPRGAMNLAEAWGIVIGGLVLYVACCGLLSRLALLLSPIPLASFVIYPYMKRFTLLAHFSVGAALAFAPLGGFVAVTGSVSDSTAVLWLAGFTLLWVTGFDVIYATLDQEFDRDAGLNSLPAVLGRRRALLVALLLHALAVGCLIAVYLEDLSGSVSIVLIAVIAAVLAAEHWLAERVNLAFFHLNIAVGFLVFGFMLAGRKGW